MKAYIDSFVALLNTLVLNPWSDMIDTFCLFDYLSGKAIVITTANAVAMGHLNSSGSLISS